MSTATLMKRIAEAAPPPRARITGAVYLAYFLTALIAAVLGGRNLVVYSDAANLIATACYVVVTLLFFDMFKPVSRGLSSLAALFSLVGCVLTTLSIFHLVPSHLPLLFFGPYCILIGYLIVRSTFLPRILGVLMEFAGVGWIMFLSPVLAKYLFSQIEVLGVLAEGSLMLWLLLFGVNVPRWNEQAGATGTQEAT